MGTTQSFSGGSLTASGIEDSGNGWYRVWLSGKLTTGQSDLTIRAFNADGDNSSIEDDAASVLYWGWQVEVGAFPTSYIPTTTAAVARAADNCFTTDMTFWGNRDDPKTIVVGFKYPPVTTSATYVLNERDTVGNSGDEWRLLYTTANTFVQQFGQTSFSENVALDTIHKAAYAHDNSGADCAFNGTLETEDTSVTLPSEASGELSFGTNTSQALHCTCWIQFVKVYNVRKPAAFLQSETA